MLWILTEAHKPGSKNHGGVLCIQAAQDSENILSGGQDGEVRMWNIGRQTKKLQSAQKVHKGPVTSLSMIEARNEGQCASCSLDGSIIVWKIRRHEILEKL